MASAISLARVTFQKDRGAAVEIAEVHLQDLLVQTASEVLCEKVGHRLCEPYEWAYKLRWGLVDEWGIADRSIGHQWFTFGQWVHSFGFRHEKTVASIPVTREWILKHYPDCDSFFYGDDEQEETD
jgi:hypothetical protein